MSSRSVIDTYLKGHLMSSEKQKTYVWYNKIVYNIRETIIHKLMEKKQRTK